MRRGACALALALSVAISYAPAPAEAAEAGAAAGGGDEGGGDDDIMAEMRAEQAKQEAAEQQAKQQAAAKRQQAQDAARQARHDAEDAKLGEVVTQQQFTVTQNGRQRAAVAKLHAGEDGAAAALRFCERYDLLSKESLLEIATKLAANLASSKPDYKPSEDTVLKSAGAYRKRSKESSKDGEYDAAVRDLLRALQRKGLEDDVKAQMERGISDALRGCADSSFCPDR